MRLNQFLFLLSATTEVTAQVHWRLNQAIRKPPIQQHASTTQSTFEQLLDHDDPSLGTFSQRYWVNADYRTGQDSPVVLLTPGEVNAQDYVGYAYEGAIAGAIAKAVGGAAIVLEHRYWGQSSPFQDLTTANLQYLTVQNAIQDLVYFSNTVELPWATSNQSSTAKNVPWILVGGSYAGALTAYTMSVSPGSFWAAYASSAPVQVIEDYWQYFSPIQRNMPQNCSSDVVKVIQYLDEIMQSGNDTQVQEMKTLFGLEGVQHNDDFMQGLQNGPWNWQSNPEGFQQWCDYVEGNTDSGPEGVGLQSALQGYANWMQKVFLPQSCNNNPACINTYDPNASWYSDTSVDNGVNRQWEWILCNEFGFWQTGTSVGRPSIVSRLVNQDYWSRQCGYYFPSLTPNTTYPAKVRRTDSRVNQWTGGWDVDAKNLTRTIFVTGSHDPWGAASVSSHFRPGGPFNSTETVIAHYVPNSTHTCDMLESCLQSISGGQDVWDASVKQMVEWVETWPSPSNKSYS